MPELSTGPEDMAYPRVLDNSEDVSAMAIVGRGLLNQVLTASSGVDCPAAMFSSMKAIDSLAP